MCGVVDGGVQMIWNSSEEPANGFAKVFPIVICIIILGHACLHCTAAPGPTGLRLQDDTDFKLLEMT